MPAEGLSSQRESAAEEKKHTEQSKAKINEITKVI